MPIFQYQCNKCKHKEDKLVSRNEADSGKEFDCSCADGKLSRSNEVTAATLRFKGHWSGTTGRF